MVSAELPFGDRYGLHPRAAMRIQQTAAEFRARVTVQPAEGHGRSAEATSLIALVSLGVGPRERVRIAADGEDEAAALAAVRELIASGVCHP